mmetsp:Transcript_11395/g.41707  ORF Transcript_11395/g.41707 Transcript_11395/m.41707 type:complete len:127 (-) Transcript_11395:151-531(-)
MLMERNPRFGNKISFVDIADDNYDPETCAGITFAEAMEEIHAILPDGRIITGIEVFRRLYEAVGLGWIYAVTQYEPVEKLANQVYGIWAKYRLPITGKPDLETLLEMRRRRKEGTDKCGEDECEVW